MTSAADPKLIADVLVNLFGALGTLVVAYDLRRSDPNGPVTGRAIYALGLVAALFLMRCLAWSTTSGFLAALVDILAAMTPLAGLLVAEGLLRRHAPRWLKLAILGGDRRRSRCSPSCRESPWSSAVPWNWPSLPAGSALSEFCLWTRDRTSLTEGENASVRRVVIAMALLVPLIATDFRSIWPDTPLRFGAVGALVVLFFGVRPAAAVPAANGS